MEAPWALMRLPIRKRGFWEEGDWGDGEDDWRMKTPTPTRTLGAGNGHLDCFLRWERRMGDDQGYCRWAPGFVDY